MSTPLEGRKIRVVVPTATNPKDNKIEQRKLRTAAYCRVSTDSKAQETSFDSQVTYYTDLINNNPNWTLVNIYADPAVSGTSRRNRIQFNQMLFDCIHGKIDQIITKSMSRFARNQLDSLAAIRLLRALHPPVNVLFEDDHINTNDMSTELLVSIFSMLAEQESAKKSDNVKWGFERRIEQGHYMVPTTYLLGYSKTEAINKDDRKIYIVEDEAKTVRVIYLMFLAGYRISEIAYTLMMAKVPTGKGNFIWNSSSVLGILKNERYAGDVRTNKSYVESFRAHKTRKNKGEMKYVYETDHHPAIVSHEEFDMVQKLLASHKYGYDPFVNGSYMITVINEGLLRGFVPINVHWAGSTLEDYIKLSSTVPQKESVLKKIKTIEYYPGFEVVRTQDVGHSKKGTLRVSPSSITLSMSCMEIIPSDFVEILFNPVEKLLAIRPVKESTPGAIKWRQEREGRMVPVSIGCACFTKLVYELMGWPVLWNTAFLAQAYSKSKQIILFFNLNEQEINALPYLKPKKKSGRESDDIYYNIEAMIAQQIEMLHCKTDDNIIIEETTDEPEIESTQPYRRKKLHPIEWIDNFGLKSHIAETACRRFEFKYLHEWKIDITGQTVSGYDLHVVVSADEVEKAINELNSKDKNGGNK